MQIATYLPYVVTSLPHLVPYFWWFAGRAYYETIVISFDLALLNQNQYITSVVEAASLNNLLYC